MQPTLTIGLPTYNRCEPITANLKHLQDSKLPDGVKILVIDNDSSDDTFESLVEICNPEITRILKNDENIGYARNLVRLFDECDTEYLLVTSDEDFVITENLNKLLEFISTVNSSFISPQAFIKERLYRGIETVKIIAPNEYRKASFYISGLTYKMASSSYSIKTLKSCLEKNYAIATTYPQFLLAIIYILLGDCYWCDIPICKKQFDLKSKIADAKSGKYTTVFSRWLQYSSFIDFFTDILNDKNFYSKHDILQKMLEYQLTTIKSLIAAGIREERLDLPNLNNYLSGKRKIEIVNEMGQYSFKILE